LRTYVFIFYIPAELPSQIRSLIYTFDLHCNHGAKVASQAAHLSTATREKCAEC
jgi:hypothetical protein